MKNPTIVSPQDVQDARSALLVREKEGLRARDALAAERRRRPWMAVEKDYRLEGPMDRPAWRPVRGSPAADRLRAFYAPDVTTYPPSGGSYPERACIGCSFGADQVLPPGPSECAEHDARLRVARHTV